MSTYLSLTNELLRRLGEVPMDSTEFNTARNIQSLAKDAINSSIRELLHSGQEWNFTLVTYTQTLTIGQGSYTFPANTSSVDWESFYLKRDVATNNMPAKLNTMSYPAYLEKYRPIEDTSGTGGYTVPTHVYQTQDFIFGITPKPDVAYEIEYQYWLFPDPLVEFTDNCIVPSRFDNVVIDGAMMYMMTYRSNEQSAALHREKFEQGIKTMRRLLMDEPLNVRSTVLNMPRPSPRVL